MKMRPYLIASYCSAVLLLTSCNSIDNRIQEKSAVLAGLDPDVREHVEAGYVEVAYSKDMVYVALGHPSKIAHKTSPDGDIEIWIYKNMVLPGNEGFRGLSVSSDFDITARPIPGIHGASDTRERPDTQQGSKSTSGNGFGVNLDALAAATTLPDLPTGTLHIFFFQGRVFKMTYGT